MDTLVIFDFDCTIIDVDSDPWVAQKLGASQTFDSLLARMPWNDMMDALMGILHSQGKTISDIQEALRCAPLQAEKIAAIKTAHALGCELRVVSDANEFFIRTILDKHEVTHMFRQIHTNPSHIDEEGRLRIGPFHPKTELPHGCPLCPPNMCKGRVIDRIREAIPADAKRIIYIGDGNGDFCPSLRLLSRDSVLAREGRFPLLELLITNRSSLKAAAHVWKDAQDMEDKLIKLIKVQPVDELEREYAGPCGTCATCGTPQSQLEQPLGVVSQIV